MFPKYSQFHLKRTNAHLPKRCAIVIWTSNHLTEGISVCEKCSISPAVDAACAILF